MPRLELAFTALALSLAFCLESYGGEKQTIAEAIASIRKINPDKELKAGDRDQIQKEHIEKIKKAWDTLLNGEALTCPALLAELDTIRKNAESDPWFELSAGAILLQMEKKKHLARVVEIWKRAPLDFKYEYVFYSAFYASLSRDPEYLPLLAETLRDRKGTIFLVEHAFTLSFPLTHSFIWGPMGRAGLPALRTLTKSPNPEVQISALQQLTFVKDLEALPILRAIARDEKHAYRHAALRMLGEYGHPDDFLILKEGLNSPDDKIVEFALYGLREFEDLRAVPLAAAKLSSAKSAAVRNGALWTLTRLLCPESLAILRAFEPENDEERKFRDGALTQFATQTAITIADYDKMDAKKKEELFDTLRKPAAPDRVLSHADFIKATDEWIAKHRITGGTYEWVESPHVLAAAKPADMDRLIDVRSAVFFRLSDEAYEEARILEYLLRQIGRMRYRAEPGICKEVRPPTPIQ